VRTVCADINPAVVTKPADRGRDREPREADGTKRVLMVPFDEGGQSIKPGIFRVAARCGQLARATALMHPGRRASG